MVRFPTTCVGVCPLIARRGTPSAGRPRRIRVVVETVEIDPALDDARFRMPR